MISLISAARRKLAWNLAAVRDCVERFSSLARGAEIPARAQGAQRLLPRRLAEQRSQRNPRLRVRANLLQELLLLLFLPFAWRLLVPFLSLIRGFFRQQQRHHRIC